MNDHARLKAFHLNTRLLESDLNRIQEDYDVTIVPTPESPDRDDTFYPQFPAAIRAKAREMAEHFEIFYCLENAIRELVASQLEAEHGPEWWDTAVPEEIKSNADRNKQRKRDAAISARSISPIDYTTFGELSTIIDSNWAVFGDMFNSRKGLISVLAVVTD